MMKKTIVAILFCALSISAFAQVDKKDVRSGNRRFSKSNFKEAEIDYRKAMVKDSTSFAAAYDLGSALYRQHDFEGAEGVLSKVKDAAAESEYASRWFFNMGDIALQKKDYAAAVENFKQCLLRTPSDLKAKENYIYAKKMLEDQQNQQNQDQNQNQDQQDQNKDQNQDQDQQNKDQQDQNQDQNKDQQEQPAEQPQISPQQAQQMLQAIQAKEKETQDKVDKKKAEALKVRQKEKNW